MHHMRRVIVSFTLAAGALLACSQHVESSGSGHAAVETGDDGDGGTAATSGDDGDGGADGSANESCYATFHWLQKDAYKNTGGRNDPLWPPHTTTQIDVHCVDANGIDSVVASAFRDNHGTDPGTVDANGNPMLTEVKVSDPAPATRAQLLALLASYQQCECAPATQFLSTTSFNDPAVQAMIGQSLAYTQAHLICTGAVTTAQIIADVQSQDYDDAANGLQNCSWDDPNAAANELVTLNMGLSQYHVCNNDALLEVQQWETFVSTGAVVACDNTQSICQSPTWFYTP
jgi:hypothetical protein